MKILTRFEGGLGDCLCSNRFLFAIKDKYPDCHLKIAFDTDNNPKQENVMKQLWPDLYADTITLPKRKNREFIADTIFGKQPEFSDINNAPDILKTLIAESDIFYDLQINALKWLRYDFDWLRYYWFFPKPQKKQLDISKYQIPSDNFVMMHLYARPDSVYNVSQDYAKQLINTVAEKHLVVCICLKEYFSFYKDCNCILIDPTFLECFDIAEKAKCFIGIDSGIRYIPLHYSKPTFLLSKHCFNYKQNYPAQEIRWMIFERNAFPLNSDIKVISTIINNVYENTACWLYPTISLDSIDKFVINWYNFKS